MSKQTGVVDQYADSEGMNHAAWKRALSDGILLGQECTDCEQATAMPRAACVRCGGFDLEAIELPTSGMVFTETTVKVPPAEFGGPHQIAIIDLGPCRTMAGIEGTVAIGDEVELVGTLDRDVEPGLLFG